METKPLETLAFKDIAQVLSQHLADTYVLYLKTQNYHWNIVDPRFFSLHKLFEEHYEELAEAIDVVAERIRMVQGKAPGTMREFLELSQLKEGDSSLSGDGMIQDLMHDNLLLADITRAAIKKIEELGDAATVDMLTDRLQELEQRSWMLKSHLER